MSEPKIRITCSLIIEEDNKLILVKEAKSKVLGKWNQPAGHVEKNETPFECAIREAKEETGYDIDLTGLQAIYYFADEEDYIVNFCFTGRLKNNIQSKLADDVLETKWFSKQELRELPKSDFRHTLTIKRTKDWLENKKFPLEVLDNFPQDCEERSRLV